MSLCKCESCRTRCTTRLLIEVGHNLTIEGAPKTREHCLPCFSLICSYIGPVCGCGRIDCVDAERQMKKYSDRIVES